MALPFFYIENIAIETALILNEDTSRHVVQVLRMQNGEPLRLTDGKGNLFTAAITDNHKRNCAVEILESVYVPPHSSKISIAVSLLKNAQRFEWFLEKATEMGVSEIIPIICERTEKQQSRYERMQGIVISAMLQSQQAWLPMLQQPQKLQEIISLSMQQQKLIAHCEAEKNKVPLENLSTNHSTSSIILIGPEGDFTSKEIELALQHHFIPVSLGHTRLRTETAAVAAAVLLCMR